MNQTLCVSLGPRKRKHGPDTLIRARENNKLLRKKRQYICKYIYKTLFQEQKDSNVDVTALGRSWHLHKVFLRQSPTFDAIFNGTWRKANKNPIRIKIEIDDDRITEDSLDAVFGSMYSEEIDVKVDNVIPIMATATLFLTDVIKEICVKVMLETISPETATQYYEAACRYDVVAVKQSAIQWFQFNLLRVYEDRPGLLRQIPIELMLLLTASHDLLLEDEFDLYNLLRTWMFLRLHPDYDPEDPERQAKAQMELQIKDNVGIEETLNETSIIGRKYFKSRPKLSSFLATPEGRPYVGIFQKLRTQYLSDHWGKVEELFSDNIVPKEWITMHMAGNWNSLLRLDHGLDASNFQQVDDERFFQTCMRVGGLMVEPDTWRWVDLTYGINLELDLEGRCLYIKRQYTTQTQRLVSTKKIIPIMIRVTVTSFDKDDRPVYTQSTEVRSVELTINEYVPILKLERQQEFPMFVHLNLLFVVPQAESVPHMETLMVPSISGEDVPEDGGRRPARNPYAKSRKLCELSGNSESD